MGNTGNSSPKTMKKLLLDAVIMVCQHFVLGVLMAFASNFPSSKFVKIASGLIKPLVARCCPGSGHFTISHSRSLWIPSRPNRRRSGPRENLNRKLWRLPKKPEKGSWKKILSHWILASHRIPPRSSHKISWRWVKFCHTVRFNVKSLLPNPSKWSLEWSKRSSWGWLFEKTCPSNHLYNYPPVN